MYMTHYGHDDGKVGTKVVQFWLPIPDTPPSPDPNRIVVPRTPSLAYALQRLLLDTSVPASLKGIGGNSYFARPTGTSFSLNPKLVVRTKGGSSCAMRSSIMSRKPKMPSVLFDPTETNVVFTPVATPTVYCTSKLYEVPISGKLSEFPCGCMVPTASIVA